MTWSKEGLALPKQTKANRTDTLAELMSSQSLERMREVGKVNVAVE
jgi:hypothetical protein